MASWKRIALRAEERVDELRKENEQLKQDVSFWKFEYTIQHDEFANEITEKVKQNKALQAEVERKDKLLILLAESTIVPNLYRKKIKQELNTKK